MHWFVRGAVLGTSCWFLACSDSSSSTSTPVGSDGGSATPSGNDGGRPGVPADSPDTETGLKAPELTQAMRMAGGLHVLWRNRQKDCDAIEGERKTATEPYRVVFTLREATADNKHDAPLTSGATYTYRLRCKKGSEYSPYSNELTGTP